MKNPILRSFVHSLGVVLYISLVALVMLHAEKWTGKEPGFLGPVIFLTLFVVSATVVGCLVLGKPVMLYLDGQKTESIKLLAYTLSWLVVFIAVVTLIVVIK